MISILIPTYNYDCTELVDELVKQCRSCQVKFEIICQDDASKSDLNVNNETINTIPSCSFYSNSENFGRSKNRNTLAKKSSFPWLLFLDCDTMPVDANFIQNYISILNTTQSEVVFGGIEYQKKQPSQEQLLRWIYGKKREALNVECRMKNNNFSALTSNVLIKKDVFLLYPFDEELTQYGYEDYTFFAALNKANKKVLHIDNPCFHNGLETSVEFIEKTKMAIHNLVQLSRTKKELVLQNKLVKTHQKLVQFRLQKIIVSIFFLLQKPMEINLKSRFPSLFIFDLYKLGWFSNLINHQAIK
jgi:glycosyltransferase involved in cell wall biosynthesis